MLFDFLILLTPTLLVGALLLIWRLVRRRLASLIKGKCGAASREKASGRQMAAPEARPVSVETAPEHGTTLRREPPLTRA